MKFNIKNFLDNYNIYYREHGAGVKKGNIIIHCPYCGADDKDQHLGINLSNGVWGCWRNEEHRSKNLSKLLCKISPISYKQALQLVGFEDKIIEKDLFNDIVSDKYFSNHSNTNKNSKIRSLILPKDFRELKDDYFSIPYINYLISRGFADIWNLIFKYGLKYALTGDFKGRIIIPVYFNKQLVTWTSRAISPHASLRYKSLKVEDSSINIKNTIYNFDRTYENGGDVLFVVEGPIDVLKMDYYLYNTNSFAVGLHSMSVSDDQLYWLIRLFDKFKTIVLLLDRGESESMEKGIATLSTTGVIINEGILPKGINDPGELKQCQVLTLYKKWRRYNG